MISLGGVREDARARLKRHPRMIRLVRRIIRPGGSPTTSAPAPPLIRHWLGIGWFWVGTVANRLHGFETTASAFRRATRNDGRYAGWYYRLGNAERLAGDLAAAISAYERSLELKSDYRRAHFWMAVCLTQPDGTLDIPSSGGRTTREHRAIDRSLAVALDRIEAVEPRFTFWLSVAERYRGHLALAERLCMRAIEREPEHAFWLQQLAEIRRARLDWRGSVEAYQQAAILAAVETAIDGPDSVLATQPNRDQHARDNAAEVAAGDASDTMWIHADLLPSEVEGIGDSPEVQLAGEAIRPHRLALHASDSTRRSSEVRKQSGAVENWASVVALYGAASAGQPLDQLRRYWLGIALHGVGDAAEAIALVGDAVDAAPPGSPLAEDLAGVLDRLVEWSAGAGDWATAAARTEQVLDIEPTAARYFRAAVTLQRASRWKESSDAFEKGVALNGLSTAWLNRLGAARREMEDWAGTAALYRLALQHTDRAHHYFWLGFAHSKLDEWPAAVVAYEAAIARQPGRADWHFRLGLAHERTGSTIVTVDPRLGLTRTRECNLAAATAAYERSVELDPTDERVWTRLGDLYEQQGRLDAARDAFAKASELRPEDPRALHRLGRAIYIIGSRRGVFSGDEYDQLERIWSEALRIGPYHSGARQQLVRSSVRAARWEIASRTAWFPDPPMIPNWMGEFRRSVEEELTPENRRVIEAALARADDDLMVVPLEWWFMCHWRLLDARMFSLAFRAKQLMALRVLADRPHAHPDKNLNQFLEIARALNFLDRHDEAIAHLDASPYDHLPPTTRWAMAKTAADIRLLHGEVEPYAAFLALNSQAVDQHTETAFRRLLEGRRIAIVGPAQSEGDHGAEIDSHDLIIRTKFTQSTGPGSDTSAGTRTDISYYALGSVRFLGDEIRRALSRGDLQMAVFRTATYESNTRYLHRPGDLRYPPSEYQGSFRAGQFAIQRILYDVLRYSPASVKIFNINFFLAENPYRDGYLADYTKTYAERGLVQPLSAFGHDYRADFVFTQRLFHAGLIEADPSVSALLGLTPEQYLKALDAKDLG